MVDISILQQQYFGNALQTYVTAGAVFLLVLLVLYIIKKVIVQYLKRVATKTKTDFDDALVEQIKSIPWVVLIFFAGVAGLQSLELPQQVQTILGKLTLIVATYVIAGQTVKLLTYSLDKLMRHGESGKIRSNVGILQLMHRLIGIVIWSIALLFVLSNFGINVTSVAAGLGIGGIAVAFAVQSILSDIFSSFAIYFDRPFEVGDFIVLGQEAGVVEHIGIKSTRIKALRGERLIISNKEIMSTRIQNFKTLQKRRIVFNIGIVYETPFAKVKQVPALITEAFAKVENTELDRVHFSEFGESALGFEIVYYVTDPSYITYRERQQEINFNIVELFNKNKIEFAYPTRTIYTK